MDKPLLYEPFDTDGVAHDMRQDNGGSWVHIEDYLRQSAEDSRKRELISQLVDALEEAMDWNWGEERGDIPQLIVMQCEEALKAAVSTSKDLIDTVKERIADPRIVDVDVEDLVSTEQTPVCPNTATEKDCTQIGNTQEPDVNVCPGCGGYADNGFSRSVPPDPYYCTKCEPVGDRQ